MKKKLLSLALVVALVAIMVGGTLAYFTDKDEVTNVFTLGNVKIEIIENDNENWTQENFIFEKPMMPGEEFKKEIKVRNTGTNDAYIRTHIAIPSDLVGYLQLAIDDQSGWSLQYTSDCEKNDIAYTVFTYDYEDAIAKGEETPDLLKKVYLGENVDLLEKDDGSLVFVIKENGVIQSESKFVGVTQDSSGNYVSSNINILVVSQAIQADSFADATDALTSGFGTGTNPWKN